jgi:hypothetical protein
MNPSFLLSLLSSVGLLPPLVGGGCFLGYVLELLYCYLFNESLLTRKKEIKGFFFFFSFKKKLVNFNAYVSSIDFCK